ncbi:hypothetical protein M3J09_008667 [Ascochyta lentis]
MAPQVSDCLQRDFEYCRPSKFDPQTEQERSGSLKQVLLGQYCIDGSQ